MKRSQGSISSYRFHKVISAIFTAFTFCAVLVVVQGCSILVRYKPKEEAQVQSSNEPADARSILAQPFASNIIVSESLRLIYCPIPKSASSNWKYLIRSLEHQSDHMDLHLAHNRNTSHFRYLSDYSPSELEHLLADKSYLKFTFVRNPYLRILSCYMDKFRNMDANYTSSEYRIFLAAAFSWKTARLISSSEHNSIAIRPSFRTFIKQIVQANLPLTFSSLNNMDAHWRPQTLLCGFGMMPYDFVGRMETIDRDVHQVLRHIGRDKTAFPTQSDLNFPPSGASETLARQLYTAELMFSVRTLYLSDFETLGYL